jgi:hypothetical protein
MTLDTLADSRSLEALIAGAARSDHACLDRIHERTHRHPAGPAAPRSLSLEEPSMTTWPLGQWIALPVLKTGQKAQAEAQLAKLQAICDGCEETADLAKAIAAAK